MKRIILFYFLLPIAISAQISENFSDGNFTSNPQWLGDTANFQITSSSAIPPDLKPALQLKGDEPDTSSLYLPNELLEETEWQFWVKLSFNTSDNNNLRVYLVSDTEELEEALNGYYIQVGGANDSIGLFRQDGMNHQQMIFGSVAYTGNSTNQLRIRVTRDASGLWKLYSDPDGGINFQQEGSATDNTYASTNWFGIFCKYTSSNSTKFYFDDFYVQPIDNEPPSLESVEPVNEGQIKVTFSEPVDSVSASEPGNYLVNNGIGVPSGINSIEGDPASWRLFFSNTFDDGVEYQLLASNIADLDGNVMTIDSALFTYYAPIAAGPHDVVINEIMADPNPPVGLPQSEYLELYNKTSNAFDLQGWTISFGNSTKTFPSVTILPDSFLILTKGDSLNAYGPVLDIFTSNSSLSNAGTSLVLKDSSGLIISSVSYTDDWYHDPEKDDGGWSIEQIDPHSPCIGEQNWRASEDLSGGTPGSINSVDAPNTTVPVPEYVSTIDSITLNLYFSHIMDSLSLTNVNAFEISPLIGFPQSVEVQEGFRLMEISLATPLEYNINYTLTIVDTLLNCTGEMIELNTSLNFMLPVPGAPFDVVINEIMADPTPPVGIPEYEYLELLNRTSSLIDMEGWVLRIGNTEKTFPAVTIEPDTLLILADEEAQELLEIYGPFLGFGTFSLTNAGALLQLIDEEGELISSVNYSDSWYQDDEKEEGGWSLEQIDPNNPCAGGENWIASEHPDGGTPGAANSVFASNPVEPSIEYIQVFDSLNLQVRFSHAMDSLSLLNPEAYDVSPDVGFPESVEVIQGNSGINLDLSISLKQDVVYTLEIVDTILNCMGEMLEMNTMVEFRLPTQGNPFEVVINEIMADPTPPVGLPEYEYVELFNRTPRLIEMDQWQLIIGESEKTFPSITIEPDSFLVIADDEAAFFFESQAPFLGFGSLALPNSGTSLQLRDAFGRMISNVVYQDDWYEDDDKAEGGWSLEQINPGNPCAGDENWQESASSFGGTPGRTNSINYDTDILPKITGIDILNNYFIRPEFNQLMDSLTLTEPGNYRIDNEVGYPANAIVAENNLTSVILELKSPLVENTLYTLTIDGELQNCVGEVMAFQAGYVFGLPQPAEAGDLYISEILFNPADEGVDFVELYSQTTKILDLQELDLLSIRDSGDTTSVRIAEKTSLLLPQSYMVLTSDPTKVRQQYYTPHPDNFVKVEGFPSYNNDRGNVALAKGGAILDQFEYNEDMHFPLLNSVEGVSLERISFIRPSSDATNWHSASENAGFATPAYENSQTSLSQFPGTNAEFTVEPEVFSPDNDGLDDVVNIGYKFESPGNMLTITIFDSQGRLVRNLIRNEMAGTEGAVSWDGVNEDNEKANIGIYVIFIETFDLKGNTSKEKKTCVLGSRL